MKNLRHYGMVLIFFLMLCCGIGTVQTVYSEDELISMDFDGVPLRDVLRVLSQQSGINFVASEEIQSKKVNVAFDQVPVQSALEGIVSANNLRYEKKSGKVYVIFPAAVEAEKTDVILQTRVIRLKYTRLSNSPLDVGGNDAINALITAQATSGGGVANAINSASQNKQNDAAGGSDEKDKKSKLMAERGIDKLVESLLSEEGKVAVDLASNSLIVTDTPQKLGMIEDVIAKLDIASSQVMLEVYIMEVKKDVLDQQGTSFGGVVTLNGPQRTTGFPFTENVFKNNGIPFKPELGTVNPHAVLTQGTLDASNFAIAISYLVNRTDTKVLARPRVLTLNNQAASIKLVTSTATAKIAILTAAQSISTLQTGGAEREQVGINLKITPQINKDQTIDLYMEPSVTSVAPSKFFPNDFLDPTTRSVKTMARVKDNETLVLGGLVDSDQTAFKSKVPLLGDLPFIGKAFRYTSRNDSNRELLIFITPHIVKGFDSLTDPSATAQGQDISYDRMADAFPQESKSAPNSDREKMIQAAEDSVTIVQDKTSTAPEH